jgi:hypothetical protein
LPRRCCRYCQVLFEPSKFRPDQRICHQPECQRRRRREYHRHKTIADPEYAQVVRDSRRKWRQAHPGYQQLWRQSHPEAQERNRQLQHRRDAKRRVQLLVKNNSALDLKHAAAEVWLIGPAAGGLEKNNIASSKLFIFQSPTPVAAHQPAS